MNNNPSLVLGVSMEKAINLQHHPPTIGWPRKWLRNLDWKQTMSSSLNGLHPIWGSRLFKICCFMGKMQSGSWQNARKKFQHYVYSKNGISFLDVGAICDKSWLFWLSSVSNFYCTKTNWILSRGSIVEDEFTLNMIRIIFQGYAISKP